MQDLTVAFIAHNLDVYHLGCSFRAHELGFLVLFLGGAALCLPGTARLLRLFDRCFLCRMVSIWAHALPFPCWPRLGFLAHRSSIGVWMYIVLISECEGIEDQGLGTVAAEIESDDLAEDLAVNDEVGMAGASGAVFTVIAADDCGGAHGIVSKPE